MNQTKHEADFSVLFTSSPHMMVETDKAKHMKIRELASSWGKANAGSTLEKSYTLTVPVNLAAKIAALSEMYQQTENEILNDLLNAALLEVESSMPYVQGRTVIGEDECGDPIFEDVGPTPRFIELSRKHLGQLRKLLLA